MFDDHTGSGAVPLGNAVASRDLNRSIPAVSPMILAAVSAPQPGSSSSAGASCVGELGDLFLQRLDGDGEFSAALGQLDSEPGHHSDMILEAASTSSRVR